MFGKVESAENLPIIFSNNFINYRLPSEKYADPEAARRIAGNIRFCGCFPINDITGFSYRIDTAGLRPIMGKLFSDSDAAVLMQCLAAVLGFIRDSGLYSENLVLLPNRVFTDGSSYFFQYIPVKRRREQKPARLLASVNRFFTMISPGNSHFSAFVDSNDGRCDLTENLLRFASEMLAGSEEKLSSDAAEIYEAGSAPDDMAYKYGQSGVSDFDDSEGETTYFGANTTQDDSEGETTYFGANNTQENSEGETTYFGANTTQDDSEGETTYFGANSTQDDSEGETTYFGANNTQENSEGETTLLGTAGYSAGCEVSLIRAINGEELPLPQGTSVIGSVPGYCDVVIPNRSMSRRHAEITVENGSVYIRDLDSTNGTIADGIILAPGARAEVFDGSFISFGSESVNLRICAASR